MPSISIGGTTFDKVTRFQEIPFKVAAEHTMMDGEYRQDVYANKRRWAIGWDIMTATDKNNLITKFNANTTHTFIDLDSNSYTVVFEDDRLSIRRRVEDVQADQRYQVDIVLRQV